MPLPSISWEMQTQSTDKQTNKKCWQSVWKLKTALINHDICNKFIWYFDEMHVPTTRLPNMLIYATPRINCNDERQASNQPIYLKTSQTHWSWYICVEYSRENYPTNKTVILSHIKYNKPASRINLQRHTCYLINFPNIISNQPTIHPSIQPIQYNTTYNPSSLHEMNEIHTQYKYHPWWIHSNILFPKWCLKKYVFQKQNQQQLHQQNTKEKKTSRSELNEKNKITIDF